MKKLNFIFVLIIGLAAQGFAQFSVGGTLGAQMPMGNFGDSFNPGFGLQLTGRYAATENVALGLNLGYNSFGTELDSWNGTMTPITALAEYYFAAEGLRPFVGLDLGFYTYKVTVEVLGTSTSASDSFFGVAPKGGVLYDLNEQLSLLGELKYHYVMVEDDAATWLGINAGVVYRF